MPISTIAGTRIEFLRSLSIGLRTNDSGVDPDLKQKIDLRSLTLMTVPTCRLVCGSGGEHGLREVCRCLTRKC